jgi:hypothetical protein
MRYKGIYIYIYIYTPGTQICCTKFDGKNCPTSLHESETIQRKRKGSMEEYM